MIHDNCHILACIVRFVIAFGLPCWLDSLNHRLPGDISPRQRDLIDYITLVEAVVPIPRFTVGEEESCMISKNIQVSELFVRLRWVFFNPKNDDESVFIRFQTNLCCMRHQKVL